MEEQAKRTFRPPRIVALCFFGLLWLCVALLSLELFARGYWLYIRQFNPYVHLGKQYRADWGQLDLTEDGKLVTSQRDMKQTMPPPAPEAKEDHLGTLFASLDEPDRALYADLQHAVMFLSDADARISKAYAYAATASEFGIEPARLPDAPYAQDMLWKGFPDAAQMLRRVFSTAAPEAVSGSLRGIPARIASFPMKDASGRVVSVASALFDFSEPQLADVIAPEAFPQGQPQWKIPWLEYKKNVRLPEESWFTNNVGFWDDDVAIPKPPGTFRIVCVGGSTTEEGWVAEWSYPNILEKILNDKFGGTPRFEVINAGVVALDARTERKRMLDYIRLQPDLIVEYNVVNDFCHRLLPQWCEEMPRSAKIVRHSEFINRYFNRLLWPSDPIIAERLRATRLADLAVMCEVAHLKRIPIAFASFASPDPAHLKHNARDFLEWQTRTFWQGKYYTYATYRRMVLIYNALLQELCKEKGAIYLPVAEEFNGDLTCFADICHMRPKGIQRKAEIMASHLEGYLKQRLAHKEP